MAKHLPIAHINDFENTPSIGFAVGSTKGFIVKKKNNYFAYTNSCPHLGVELNWSENNFLDMDKTFIHCFTHGALFLIDSGECISGPCVGKALKRLDITVDSTGAIFLILAN